MNSNYLLSDIKKLGFGLMRPPFIDEAGDLELMKTMVDAYLEAGFSYFDTSYFYGRGASERAMGKVIVNRHPRESFHLATKLPMWVVDRPEDTVKCLDESLSRAGVDYFDMYMLHGLSAGKSDRFPGSYMDKADEFGAWEFLKRAKADGKAKHIGFSFHDSAEVLDSLLNKHPEAEFVQLQINFADWEDETIQSRRCYETAIKHGVPVIIMEPLKGGTLLRLRPEVEDIFRAANPEATPASWALRFCASLDGVITVLSGMQSPEIVHENISFMQDFKPLTAEEHTIVAQAAEVLRNSDTIGCTACRYCVDDCPQNIPIPGIFEIVNENSRFANPAYAKRRYGNLTDGCGKASDCLACGACESHCPQKLDIIEKLSRAAELLEIT